MVKRLPPYAAALMGQRITDASVLGLFALMYNCAVFILRFRKQN
jgi:hypothetical protein